MGALRIREFFDIRSGLFGAAIMSGLVWWINVSHGVWPATTAALKQAAYTFLFGGLIMRLCGAIAEHRGNQSLRISAATIVPSLITTLLVYAVHSARGTPEPVLSTLPAAVLSPPAFFLFARRRARAALEPGFPEDAQGSPASAP